MEHPPGLARTALEQRHTSVTAGMHVDFIQRIPRLHGRLLGPGRSATARCRPDLRMLEENGLRLLTTEWRRRSAIAPHRRAHDSCHPLRTAVGRGSEVPTCVYIW
jgi:hypothetical protein